MFCKFKIISVLLALSLQSLAIKPSKHEVWWAIWHPFAALKVKKIHAKASFIYDLPVTKIELDSFSSGGKLDAFRHSFFMAAFAQKIKTKKLRKLGVAHEKDNYNQFLKHQTENGEAPDSLSSVMDLYNNELGFKVGSENKKLCLEELKQKAIKEINAGNAFILKRNKNKEFVDCNNTVIDLKAFEKKWFVPKCLTPSN